MLIPYLICVCIRLKAPATGDIVRTVTDLRVTQDGVDDVRNKRVEGRYQTR